MYAAASNNGKGRAVIEEDALKAVTSRAAKIMPQLEGTAEGYVITHALKIINDAEKDLSLRDETFRG